MLKPICPIGLCGPIGAGKSTVAEILWRTQAFEVIPFAKPLKNMGKALGLTDDQLYGSAKERPVDYLCGKTPREIMQTLGTEWGRMLVGEDFWVRCWEREASKHGYWVVADDARFENEFAAIRKHGGVVLRVLNPRASTSFGGHASEEAWKRVTPDATIINDGGFAILEDRTLEALDAIRARRLLASLPQPMRVET